MAGFSLDGAKRVARATRAYEAQVKRRAGPGHRAKTSDRMPVVLQDNLRDEHVKAKARYPSDPNDDDNYDWTTDDEEIDVYPWGIPDGYQVPNGQECWVTYWGGRWYVDTLAECLVEIPEEE